MALTSLFNSKSFLAILHFICVFVCVFQYACSTAKAASAPSFTGRAVAQAYITRLKANGKTNSLRNTYNHLQTVAFSMCI
jgi:hypothetical protein